MSTKPAAAHFASLNTGWFSPTKREGCARIRPGFILLDEHELSAGEDTAGYLEAMLNGSSSTPTYVLCLAMHGTALYLVFDALEPRAKAHLAAARKERYINLTARFGDSGSTVTTKKLRLSPQPWERQRSKSHQGSEAWLEQLKLLLPAVVPAITQGLPHLRTIDDHRIFLMLPPTPAELAAHGLAVRAY